TCSFLTASKKQNTAKRAGCCRSSDERFESRLEPAVIDSRCMKAGLKTLPDPRGERQVLCFWRVTRFVGTCLELDRHAGGDRRACVARRDRHRKCERHA